MDQGSTKIFLKSSKGVNLRLTWIGKFDQLQFSKSSNFQKIEDHERVKDQSSIYSNFQNLRKVLPRVHRRSRVDQGSTKIFPKSSKDVNMDWKVRSIPIFKIFERYYLEIHSLEVTRELEKIHRWQKLEFIDSRVDLPKSFQILRKMLTLNKTRIGKFDGLEFSKSSKDSMEDRGIRDA